MSFINVGAYINGERPASKKALREALANAPESVRFDGTALLGEQFNGPPSTIPAGVKLSVAGPDPYTSRKWFATVEHKAGGGFKLS